MNPARAIRLLCSDLDGTLLGEPDGSREFAVRWERLGEPRPLLVYSSGRLHDDARRQVEAAGLPPGDFIISGVGTMIHDGRACGLTEFGADLGRCWDPDLVDRITSALPGIERQPGEQLHRWKRSWFWHDRSEADLENLRRALRDAGLEAQVVYSSQRDLDVLPAGANKGNALRWLCARQGVPLDEIVVAGDTGNDVPMFLLPGVRGLVPGNVDPELLAAIEGAEVHRAKGRCAFGITEGLEELGLFQQ